MPVHDWTRVPSGTFHDFHVTWIPLIKDVLNDGVLPRGYYAMAEQQAGLPFSGIIPDVLTLQESGDEQLSPQQSGDGGGAEGGGTEGGGTMVAASPRATITARLDEQSLYAAKANRLVIRHHSEDRVVAILEVLSRGNKSGQRAIDQFVYKTTTALLEGVHLLLIDLHPPLSRDPEGIHGVIWAALSGTDDYRRPPDKPLTLAAYSGWWVDTPIAAFIEPIAVGDSLPPMPLFLEVDRHVLVPLESSYMSAVSKIPQRARRPLES